MPFDNFRRWGTSLGIREIPEIGKKMTDDTDELYGKPLTPREQEACDLMVRAPDEPYIWTAAKMNIKRETLAGYLEQARKKTGYKSTFSMLFRMAGKGSPSIAEAGLDPMMMHLADELAPPQQPGLRLVKDEGDE